jgi:hypothetical protein
MSSSASPITPHYGSTSSYPTAGAHQVHSPATHTARLREAPARRPQGLNRRIHVARRTVTSELSLEDLTDAYGTVYVLQQRVWHLFLSRRKSDAEVSRFARAWRTLMRPDVRPRARESKAACVQKIA